MANPASLTGQYLSRARVIPVPAVRRKPSGKFVTIHNPREHNLKGGAGKIPLGTFTCITGVSGSGKSTLVNDILYRALAQMLYRAQERPGAHDRIEGAQHVDKVIDIDQSPIGRTPRSNPATYTGVFTFIRTLFARTADARMRGYRPGRFSFNVTGGRRDACQRDRLVKTADWIIDLGPAGGDEGGRVVATGTPEDVARIETSYTGQFLRAVVA